MPTIAIHGIATVVEFPGRASFTSRNLQGTRIRQPANTDNWLHVPLPWLWSGDFGSGLVSRADLVASVNENARLDLIRVTDSEGIKFEEEVSFTDRIINEH